MPEVTPQTAAEFIATARKRFEASAADEKLIREEAMIDLKYVAGEQWDPKLKQDRERAGRPALTFPRCHTFVQQVSNEARQNKPQIKFAPGDHKADQDTADVYEGLAREIQYSSDAQIAYETSVEYSAGGSIGYFRFVVDYADDDSDEQVIKILPVYDPFAVYGILVPYCFGREPKFGFVVEDMPTEEYKDLYPKSSITTDANFDQGGRKQGWVGTETCRIAEYWWCEDVRIKAKNGRVKTRSKVHQCKMSWAEVLEDTTTDWLGYCIPIIPVTGKVMIVEGKPIIMSVVRHQRGAQQMINYSKSRIAETLATAPISPYLVAEGQIVKGDKKWENLNTQIFPYLTYKQVDIAGKPAPPPQRQTFEPPIAALSSFVAQEIDDMKATTGIFDASLGQKSNETSGQAIARRQQQANMTTMHYMDNLERAFKKGGLILEDLIPKIYDADRMIRILGEDETPKVVRINAEHVPPNKQKSVHYKMADGKYNVIVTMGRAFSTKRQESFDMMQQLVQSAPNLLPMFGDVLFQNSDAAGADIVAERFKKMLPPNLQDQDENQDPQQQLQQLQGQLMQMKQAHDALNAYAAQLEKEKEGKVIENQGRAQIAQMQEETKRSVALMQEETKRYIAEVTTKIQDTRERLKLAVDLDKQMHVSAHEQGMSAQSHEQAKELAAQQSEAQAQQQLQGAEIQSAQSAQDHAQSLEAQQQAAAQSAAEKSNA